MYFKNQFLFLFCCTVLWTKSQFSTSSVDANENDVNRTSTDGNKTCSSQFKNCSLQINSTASSNQSALNNASIDIMGNIASFIDYLQSSARCFSIKRIKRNEYTVLNKSAVELKKDDNELKKDDKVLSSDFYITIGVSANQSQEILLCMNLGSSMPRNDCIETMPPQVPSNVSDLSFNQSNWIDKVNLPGAQSNRKVRRVKRYSPLCQPIDKVASFNDNRDASKKHDFILSTLTFIFMMLSVIALVFLLVTYSLFSELRTTPGINLMNLSASILLSQLLWVVGTKRTENPMACTAIAVLLHYLFLASFVWTAIIAFDTWKTFCSKHRILQTKLKRACCRYMALGWLSVMVYVSICVGLDQSQTVSIGYGSREVCWIASSYSTLYFFGIPAGLVIAFNIVLFTLTVKGIRDTRKQTRPAIVPSQSENRLHLGTYLRIASLMGFTWVFGFAASFTGLVYLSYVFVVLHSLQGMYLAAAFGLTKRTRKLYKKFFQGKRKGYNTGQSNAATHTSQL